MAGEVYDTGLIVKFADSIGASESALRLLLALLAGYPLGFIHRHFFYGSSPWLQHLYFTICGLSLGYFNFGIHGMIHPVINTITIYILLLVAGGTTLSITLAITINMIYLIIGYYVSMTPEYIVTWTTPQCVLTLRLIGLVFDVYDGHKRPDKLTEEQKITALPDVPTVLEVLGHTFFFGGFLVGPQFPMSRYLDFVHGKFSDSVTGEKPRCVGPALLRLSGGMMYTLIFQVGSIYFPDSYLTSPEFGELGFVWRCIYVTIWGKITLYKYLACWIITEGICILAGLTYNGKDENGNDLWDGCANIKIRKYERAWTLGRIIEAFNINTNRWMAKYIFKRLRFLGSKPISQFVTLFFLAIWHGLYSGYFMCFGLEFVMMKFEREITSMFGPLLANMKIVQMLTRITVLQPLIWLLLKTYSQFFLSYALVSFCLFTYDMWGHVYGQTYFCIHIILITWPLVYPVLKTILRSPKSHTNGSTQQSQKTE